MLNIRENWMTKMKKDLKMNKYNPYSIYNNLLKNELQF
jgi:hypothetical protein